MTSNVVEKILPSFAGPPFIGFTVSCILYGFTILQAYQYFMNYPGDSRTRKAVIATVCSLDTLHFIFSACMMYPSISGKGLHPNPDLVWTLQGMSAAGCLLIVVVQSYYLRIIWTFARNSINNPRLSKIIQTTCMIIIVYAVVVIACFQALPNGFTSFVDFSSDYKHMIYVGYITAACIDTFIAVTLSYLLLSTSPRSHQHFKSRGVVRFLILFFIGSGVLTAICAITTLVVYLTNPSTVFYLAIQFPCARLYANSILAMFNSKARLHRTMQRTSELKVQSLIIFGEDAGVADISEREESTEF